MTVTQTSAYLYIGLAGDTKPTTGVIKGARFIETDTDEEYIFDGSAWAEISPGVVEQKTYTTLKNGELQGSVTALQLPDVACSLVRFKARSDNAGHVYIGGSTVTKPDDTTDITTGLELAAGDETGWLPVSNLNVFYRICDNAGDDLTYLALA